MKKTIDVFVTSNEGTEKDEEWIMPVWSVELVKESLAETDGDFNRVRHGNTVALVANWATPWIMPSFGNPGTADHPKWPVLSVGDLVRVGNVDTSGYTDYLTVMEVIPVDKLGSGITGLTAGTGDGEEFAGPTISWVDQHSSVSQYLTKVRKSGLDAAGNGTADAENTTRFGTDTQAMLVQNVRALIDFNTLNDPHYAYRLNFSLNCTTPPIPPHRRAQKDDELRVRQMLEERHNIELNSAFATSTAVGEGQYYRSRLYPLFRVKAPPAVHKVQLDRGIKAVHWIKLYAATFVNKRAVGFQSAHEVVMDDWVALRLQEVQGEVISNNPTANGSFTILHCGHHDDALTGAKEVRLDQDAPGITTVYFERPRTDMRSLTVELRDRLGDLAHLGRIHLWFKLCVSHG